MSNSTCTVPGCEASIYTVKMCRPHYRRLRKYGDPLGEPVKVERPHNSCSVEGCGKLARSRVAEFCPMHYHRLYRHGDLEAKYTEIHTGTPRTYQLMYAKGHPAAQKNGRAYVHRVVLFDALGAGPHGCHWCGIDLHWFLERGDSHNLVVDHINGDKSDNRLPNLIPTCNRCNAGRAIQERHKTLRDEHGAWSGNDTIAALRSEAMRRKPAIVRAA